MLGPETANELDEMKFNKDKRKEAKNHFENKVYKLTIVLFFLVQLFVIFFMWPTKAHAIQPDQKCKRAILTWEPPASRVNGQPLTIEELDYYEVEVRDDATGEVEAYIFNNFPAKIEDHGPVREYFYSSKQDQIRPLRAGNQCFKIRVVDTGVDIVNGIKVYREPLASTWSKEVCKQICLWNGGLDLNVRIGVTDE